MIWILIRMASWLLPRGLRGEWRREWEAEIWYSEPETRSLRTHFQWACGAIKDASYLAFQPANLSRSLSDAARTPAFCITLLVAALLAIVLLSRGLPVTRTVFTPLKYADADNVATVSRASATLSVREGIPAAWSRLWAERSTTLGAIAPYLWKYSSSGGERLLTSTVSENFFSLLDDKSVRNPALCPTCVLISHSFREQRFASDRDATGKSLVLDGRPYRIAGVLPEDFWFLSRQIAVWKIGSVSAGDAGAGLVVRVRRGVTPQDAERELRSLIADAGYGSWDSIAVVSPIQERVRSPLWSFALAVSLALIVIILGSRPRLANLDVTSSGAWRRGVFFTAKSALLLLVVLIAGLEFTNASSITMIGGTDLLSEPLSTWLFLIGCMTALTWSVQDHRVRCRVCMHRLGLAAHVGCPGSLLLNWAGTEMVCISGHGMLHVPEMRSSWMEPERWTLLDNSWQELFSATGSQQAG